jgi:hypothetical protein
MIYKPKHFKIQELVCEHVYNHYTEEQMWGFFDIRFLITQDLIAEKLGKPVYLNNWHEHGPQSQSGLRCPFCSLVKDKIDAGQMYMSAHMRAQAGDSSVKDMEAEEVRQWLIGDPSWLPYPIRLESGVAWVHMDVCNTTDQKIILFNS